MMVLLLTPRHCATDRVGSLSQSVLAQLVILMTGVDVAQACLLCLLHCFRGLLSVWVLRENDVLLPDLNVLWDNVLRSQKILSIVRMLRYSSRKIAIDRRAWLNDIAIGSLDHCWVNFGSQRDARRSFRCCAWVCSLHGTRVAWWPSWAFLLRESFWLLAWTHNVLRNVDEVTLTVFLHAGTQLLGCSALGCRVLIRSISLSWTLNVSLYDRALRWVSHAHTTMVIGCAVLHCNEFGTLGHHRILGIYLIWPQSIVSLIAAVLQASVLCSGPHIVSLVWLTTWNCHWGL